MKKYQGKNLLSVLGNRISDTLVSKEEIMEKEDINLEEKWNCVNGIHVPGDTTIEGTNIITRCSKCGNIMDIQELDIAPDGALAGWTYTTSGDYITLTRYNGSNSEVIVYPVYKIGDKIYKTKIYNSNASNGTLAMFGGNNYITSVEFKEGIDYSEFTDMKYMFNACQKLQSIIFPKDFDTSRVVSMENLFSYCAFTKIDVSMFNTSNVKLMNHIFNNCSKLTLLDLTSWNTNKVTSMQALFQYCSNLKQILVSKDKWVTASNNTYMFNGCGINKVTYVD